MTDSRERYSTEGFIKPVRHEIKYQRIGPDAASADELGDPRHECYRKKRYWTEKFAKSIAREIEDQRGVALKVYGCLHCGGYHLAKDCRRRSEARR